MKTFLLLIFVSFFSCQTNDVNKNDDYLLVHLRHKDGMEWNTLMKKSELSEYPTDSIFGYSEPFSPIIIQENCYQIINSCSEGIIPLTGEFTSSIMAAKKYIEFLENNSDGNLFMTMNFNPLTSEQIKILIDIEAQEKILKLFQKMYPDEIQEKNQEGFSIPENIEDGTSLFHQT